MLDPAANKKKQSTKSLTKHELSELQNLSRDFQEIRPKLRKQTPALGPPSWLIHLIMGSIILIGVLIFTMSETKRSRSPKRERILPFEFAEYIGEKAVVPIGAFEVKGAEYANCKELAEGSQSALDTQKFVAKEKKLPLEIENSIGIRLRLIPGPATFVMGSPDNETGRGPDETQHVEPINQPFYMGKYEVTQEQFFKVMAFNPSRGKKIRGADFPVQEVTWNDARKFCRELSLKEGLKPGTYRLPFENEWEYACRAGTTTPYYFGSDLKFYQDFMLIDHGMPEKVGLRRPNAWGLYNMHGNLWEWCQNRFYIYTSKQSDNTKRSIRGGCWRISWDRARSAKRACLPEPSHGNFLGFRVIRIITNSSVRRVASEELSAPGPGPAHTE